MLYRATPLPRLKNQFLFEHSLNRPEYYFT